MTEILRDLLGGNAGLARTLTEYEYDGRTYNDSTDNSEENRNCRCENYRRKLETIQRDRKSE